MFGYDNLTFPDLLRVIMQFVIYGYDWYSKVTVNKMSRVFRLERLYTNLKQNRKLQSRNAADC